MRAYVKGDDGALPGFARNLLGSGDIFDRRGRRPWASVNFITAHDGFTLADLYAYNEKHNDANGEEEPRRARRQPLVELRRRRPDRRPRDARAARPDAALRHGDAAREPGGADAAHGRRERPQPAGQQQRLLPGQRAGLDGLEPRPARAATSAPSSPGCLRLRRELPLLAAQNWLRAEPVGPAGLPGVRWLRPDAVPMGAGEWSDGLIRAVMVALAGKDGTGVLLLSNAAHEAVPFVLPPTGRAAPWRLRLDSAGRSGRRRVQAPAGGHDGLRARPLPAGLFRLMWVISDPED